MSFVGLSHNEQSIILESWYSEKYVKIVRLSLRSGVKRVRVPTLYNKGMRIKKFAHEPSIQLALYYMGSLMGRL